MIEYKKVPTDQLDDDGQPYEYAEVDDDGKVQAYKRADGSFDIPVDLPPEYIETLTAMAAEKNISLNDFMIEIVMEEIARVTKKNESTETPVEFVEGPL